VQFGVFMQPVHDPRSDLTQALAHDRELIVMADRLGFAECWVGEHFSATVEPIASPLAFLGSLIDAAPRIRLGTGVFCLPQQHPAVIAAQAAMFDHLCGGRFLMGIGPGGLSSDFEVFKVGDPQRRGAMMRESIEQILRLWAEDPPYDIRGEFWNVSVQDMSRAEFGVGAIPKPLQKPHPPIAISLMSPESANAGLAGERGWIPISGSCLVQPRCVVGHWPIYAAAAERAGRRPDPAIWRLTRSVWIAESDAQAEDELADPDGPFAFYFRYVMSAFGMRKALHLVRPDGREQDESVGWLDIARSQVAWGSPKTVADKLLAFAERMGRFGTLLLTAHEWKDAEASRRSMRLFAERVAPTLRRALG
jgi:alkanesulfonate monooxygenase SsuD/methylene tetrahydromethanopterin reductase-like flavin-dependent oxidoreductase (luciferase family)